MNTDNNTTKTTSCAWQPPVIAVTTLATIAISICCVNAGYFIVFQNLFYFPIIIACIHYQKKGFVFSLFLSILYFAIIASHTADAVILLEAIVRVVIFNAVAGTVTFMAMALKSKEQALRESEGKYRLLFEKAADCIFVLEADGEDLGKIVAANNAAAAMHGYALAELLTMKIMDLDAPESAASAPERFTRILKGEWLRDEVVHVRKDGTSFPLEINAGLFEFDKKKHVITMERDITERRHLEKALRKSEERFRAIVEDQSEIISRFRSDGTLIYVNEVFCRFFGMKKEEILNAKWLPHVFADDIPLIERKLSGLSPSNPVAVVENRVYDANGAVRWMEFVNRGFFDANGQLIELQSVGRDVTTRKQAELKLDHERKQFLSFFNNIDESIYISDPYTYEILYVNDALLRLWGRNPVGGLCYHEFQGFDQPCEFCTNEIILKNRAEPYKWEYHNPVLDRDYEIVDRIIQWPDGREVRFEITKDITDRKRMENELRKLNEQLEEKIKERTRQLVEAQAELVRGEKLAMLGAIAAGMGNELRNPLSVMKNAVFFLKTVLQDAGDSVKEYLAIIEDEIDSSQSIIFDLLDAVRTRTPKKRPARVGEMIRRSLGRCAIPGNVMVRLDIPDSLPRINIDPFQICKVLQNLMINAVQAMPEGGTLSIGARRVSNDVFQVSDFIDRRGFPNPPEVVEISIEDTGEGISPENREKLFQPLFTTKARGIGLGLVVCKNLTEANEGRIEVESRPGEGTIFRVTLPSERENV